MIINITPDQALSALKNLQAAAAKAGVNIDPFLHAGLESAESACAALPALKASMANGALVGTTNMVLQVRESTGQEITIGEQHPNTPHKDCGCGKKGACGINGCPPGMTPMTPGAPPLMILPQCYTNCTCMSECLLAFMRHARLDFSEWSWLELAKSESEIVHINQSVGVAPGYLPAGKPIGANVNAIFMQELKQQLPFEPGLIKIDAKWTGTPTPGDVTVNFYEGDRNITNITSPQAAGLILIGRSYTLADFECKDDCFLVRWPRLFGCATSAIPHRRAIYAEFRGGPNMGQSQLIDLNTTILKRATETCNAWHNKCWPKVIVQA